MARLIATMACALLLICPLQAGIFTKKSKPSASQVAEWVHIVLNHPEASKRAQAAEALADVHAAEHPEAVTALVEALRKDGSPSVRKAAATSLGKLQPRSLEAAEALNQAIKHDDNWSVRLAARWARLGYRVPKSDQAASRSANPAASPATSDQSKTVVAPPVVAPAAVRPMPAVSPGKASVRPSSDIPQQSEPTTVPPVSFPEVPPSSLELAPPPRPQSGGDARNQPVSPSSNMPPASLQAPGKATRSPTPPVPPEPGPILAPPQQ